MSRSHRKVKIFGNWVGKSDKPHKVASHRRERRAVRIAISDGLELPIPKAYGNPAHGQRDGKSYWTEATRKDMRK